VKKNFENSTRPEKFHLKKMDEERIYSKNYDLINRL